MTEAEWLACTDPDLLVEPAGARATRRKLWLVHCACRRIADAPLDSANLYEHPNELAERDERGADGDLDAYLATRTVDRTVYWSPSSPRRLAQRRAWAREPDLVREVLGNPFRPVAFSPEWRTDTAVALAYQMYEGRDFAAMPVLADALQDAGCENDDLLGHCRDTSRTHVLGCWVVDLVLGKE